VAHSRARAGSGHGRLGAAVRVVAALLRSGEPAPPGAPASPRPQRCAPCACCTCAPRCRARAAYKRAHRAPALHTRVSTGPSGALGTYNLGDIACGCALHGKPSRGTAQPESC
jgi:hypothetical protein